MANILLADDGIEFDGHTIEKKPLGGVESSIINLTTELAKQGHRVKVLNRCKNFLNYQGVEWSPIERTNWPDDVDLYIANRGDNLINRAPWAGRTVFWIHNPGSYLKMWRYLYKLWQIKPTIIFIGQYHATTYPNWAPGGERVVIPYGIPDIFCDAKLILTPPKPRAVFTSNPLRSLDWLLDLWVQRIEPCVPGAELHLFSGVGTYGSFGYTKEVEANKILLKAKNHEKQGVRVRGPITKAELANEFRMARCMLYRGDENETFCLAVGEAQASGVPSVVRDFGSVVERVINEKTGFVTKSDDSFVHEAIRLLTDNKLWSMQHKNALDLQKKWRWLHAAQAFDRLIK